MIRKVLITAGILVLIISCERAPTVTKIVTASSPNLPDVQAAIAAAVDGDVVVIPAGTGTWTARLELTKGITLQGSTAIGGTAESPTITDKTIVVDDVPRENANVIVVNVANTKNVRITGLTFRVGSETAAINSLIQFNNTSFAKGPNKTIRVDHCHFDHVNCGKILGFGHKQGWFEGVIDHNVFHFDDGYPVNFDSDAYIAPGTATPQDYWGNGAWADYSWYGTDKFMFFEDNHVENTSTVYRSACDTTGGARYVIRKNYFHNCLLNDHGSEGGSRDARCYESYNNKFNWTFTHTGAGQRGGGSLWHDNEFTGTPAGAPYCAVVQNYRAISARPSSPWGFADGTAVWDKNVTNVGANPLDKSQHTFVEGNSSYLFGSGTVTAFSQQTTHGTITFASTNWAVNQWVGYSIHHNGPTSAPAYGLGSVIESNTATTITYTIFNGVQNPKLLFGIGDSFGVYRCLQSLDQAGTGKGDLVAMRLDDAGVQRPYLVSTGQPGFPHWISEPSIAWNNVHTPDNTDQRINGKEYFYIENRDYYNLGSGLPANTTPQKVKDLLRASVNGTDYTGPFIYPHPLVSGGGPSPSPVPTATATSSPSATPTPAGGKTFASDGSGANVQTIHDTQAVDADTITIPAGTFTWSTKVTITKGIKLQGAGIGSSIIKDGRTTAGTAGRMLEIQLKAGRLTEVTGIEFGNQSRTVESMGPTGGVIAILGRNNDGSTFRFHHCKTNKLFGDIVEDTVTGVFDHNTFNGNNHMRMYMMGSRWNGANDLGDASAGAPTSAGGGTACFWEDNVFLGDGLSGAGAKLVKGFSDGEYGARTVFRHNSFENTIFANHGLESGVARGTKLTEIYNNTFVINNGYPPNPGPVGLRSSVGIVWGNRATGWPSSIRMPLNSYRNNDYYNKWPGADGQNMLDVNGRAAGQSYWTGTVASWAAGSFSVTVNGTLSGNYSGYMLRRLTNLAGRNDPGFALITSNTSNTITYQGGVTHGSLGFGAGDGIDIQRTVHTADEPGRTGGTLDADVPWHWKNASNTNDQVTEPCYSWDNRRTEDLANTFNFDGSQAHYAVRTTGDNGVTDASQIHFHNDKEMPGYTPYTYPHPLVSGNVSPTPSPPPQPTATVTGTATATPTATVSVVPSPQPTSTPTLTPTVAPTTTPTSTPAPTPTTTPPSIPSAPSKLNANPGSPKRSITINWQNNGIVDNIEVERGDNANEFAQVTVLAGNVTEYTDRDLVSDQRYWYRIRARNSIGVSEYSNVATAPAK